MIAFVRDYQRRSTGRDARAVGEVVACKRHGEKAVSTVAAGVPYLSCGCIATTNEGTPAVEL